MNTMYTNLTKTQALMGFNITSKARCFKELYNLKSQSLPFTCSYLKPHQNHVSGFHCKPVKTLEFGISVRTGSGIGCRVKGRHFGSMSSRKDDKGGSVVKNGRTLPWLASGRGGRELKRSSWGKKSDKKFEKKRDDGDSYVSSWEVAAEEVVGEDGGGRVESRNRMARLETSSWGKKFEKKRNDGDSYVYSWEVAAEGVVGEDGGGVESGSRMVETVVNSHHGDMDDGEGVEGEDGDRENEDVDDPRWDKIKSRFRGGVDVRGGYEKPEMRRWNKQESWGRKTWKEATESSVPKMAGEGIYGVGPVLAALSAERREFYALYIQDGLDLSNNNRKKKDKKGFEKVLKIADRIGLSIKEASKHDLNMVVDNRPHQGLVLDASPLEMVKIKELESVSGEDDKGSLWVALDEVTDPQNLGAIIRSAYFFGATGIVLCAKNSAPLSGVVSKASAGSLELMELRYCKNMMQFLTSSAENGWRVLGGSVSSKAIPLNEVVPGEPTILVLGSEGTGLRPLVERSCTQLVRIPGNFPVDVIVDETESVGQTSVNSGEEFRSFLAVESLNVSVAAGVLLHHLTGNACEKVDQ